MLTPERLWEIKERCELATNGPWWTEYRPKGCTLVKTNRRPLPWLSILTVAAFKDAYDADFAAHAREDVPTLVAEVERLWAFARELRKEIERLRYAAEVAKGVSDAHRGNWCDVAFAEGKAEGLLEAVSVVEEMLNKLEAKQHAQ